MEVIEDRYEGLTIDLTKGFKNFSIELNEILERVNSKKLLWIDVPIVESKLIPILTDAGFQYYDCTKDSLRLVKKLVSTPIMPTATNHTLGVGAAIIDGDLLLVVKDKFHQGYKLPGGHVDSAELVTTALAREVFEETGIKAQFDAIISVAHFFPGQFGESNFYVVCRGVAQSKDIDIQDCEEIIEAKWVKTEEYLADEGNHIYNRRLVEAALSNRGFAIDERALPERVNWSREIFF